MNLKKQKILGIAGIIGTLFGIILMVPSYLKESYFTATLAAAILIGGLILLAVSFDA